MSEENKGKRIGMTMVWFVVVGLVQSLIIFLIVYISNMLMNSNLIDSLAGKGFYQDVFSNILNAVISGFIFALFFRFIYKILRKVPFYENQKWDNMFNFVFNIGLLQLILTLLLVFSLRQNYINILIYASVGLLFVYLDAKILNYGLAKFYNPLLKELEVETKLESSKNQ